MLWKGWVNITPCHKSTQIVQDCPQEFNNVKQPSSKAIFQLLR